MEGEEREREKGQIFYIILHISSFPLPLSLPPPPPPPTKKLNFHLSIGTLNEETTSKQNSHMYFRNFQGLALKHKNIFISYAKF